MLPLSTLHDEWAHREHLDRTHGVGTFRRMNQAECLARPVIPTHERTTDLEIIRQRAYIATREPWFLYN